MKKNILFGTLFALVLTFGVATSASAQAVDCSVTPCGNGNPEMVVNGYGVTNSQIPHIQPGQSSLHADGFTLLDCPKWYFNYCVDVTVTKVWQDQMRATAKQMQSNGWLASFPKFAYWLTH